MPQNLRDLRQKIKGVKSTRQVTKAMELVAASKMRRAMQHTQALRRYALTAWNILMRIAKVHPDAHPYLRRRPVAKVLCIVFSSDRGLCGGLNAQLFRALLQYQETLKKIPSFERIDYIAIGKKGQQFLARQHGNVIAAFPALSNHPTFKDIYPVSRLLTDAFLKGDYDQVTVLYADFVSALVQTPAIRVLLPLSQDDLRETLRGMLPERERAASEPLADVTEYRFEPSEKDVLDLVIPQLTEVQLYQTLLEATASEHSARMVAMRSATDNASEVIDDLTLTYNQTRQAGITAELAELSASKAALE